MKKKVVIVLLILFSVVGVYKFLTRTFNGKTKTEHFTIYYDKEDKKCIADIVEYLEGSYTKITKDLDCNFEHRIRVNVHHTYDSFRKEYVGAYFESVYGEEAKKIMPIWIGGYVKDNQINIISPLNHEYPRSYEGILKDVVHEFTHIAVENTRTKGFSVPRWLNEGVAEYESGREKTSLAIRQAYRGKKFPSLSDLDSRNSGVFKELHGYEYSYTIIKFIVDNYGYDKLVNLIRKPYDYKGSFELTKEEFENKWRKYVTDEYLSVNNSQ